MNMTDFLKDHPAIKMTATQHPTRPGTLMGDMPRHFRCVVRNGPRRMTVWYSQGSGHTLPPTLADVLDSMASDSQGEGNFADWCGDFGMEPDSRKAYAIFVAVQRQTAKLRRVMGADFDTLVSVDRL